MANFKQLKKCQRKINKLIYELNKILAADPLFNNIHVSFLKREYKQEKENFEVIFSLLWTNDYNNNKWIALLSFEDINNEYILEDIFTELGQYVLLNMSDYLEYIYQSTDEDEWNERCSNSTIYQHLNK